MAPENIHTHSTEGHWKFQADGGYQKPIVLFKKHILQKECNCTGTSGVRESRNPPKKNILWGEYGYFSEYLMFYYWLSTLA